MANHVANRTGNWSEAKTVEFLFSNSNSNSTRHLGAVLNGKTPHRKKHFDNGENIFERPYRTTRNFLSRKRGEEEEEVQRTLHEVSNWGVYGNVAKEKKEQRQCGCGGQGFGVVCEARHQADTARPQSSCARMEWHGIK